MKNALAILLTMGLLASTAVAEGPGTDIRIIDNQVSVQVDAMPLGRLIRLLDQATGMTSKVPPELANRNISVRFSNLKFDDAIRKLFEGQAIDYVLVPGKSLTITGVSKTMTAQGGPAPFNPPQDINNNPFDNDNNTFMPQPPPNPNAQPAVIQTPFGPIQNPNRQVQGQAGQQQPNGPTPMVLPGQTTTGGNNTSPFGNNSFNTPFGSMPNTNAPATTPGLQSNPFGYPSPTNPGQTPSGLPSSGFPTSAPPRPNP
jgi:hypothetical protein